MTLLEVMIALSLFAVGSLGALAAFSIGMGTVGNARFYGIAAAALRSEMEDVTLTPYSQLASVGPVVFTPGGLLGEPVVFKKTWTVTPNLVQNNSTVQVTIQWIYRAQTLSINDQVEVSE